ncbi:MAG: amino acid adenylation domain-containing protein [Blastocatellia bacterium]|nr:amino acid adenylation domain-containing protein [Blastocatellia bacterium]
MATTAEVFLFPVSFAQRRLWFIDQFGVGSAVYHLPGVFRLRGELQTQVLTQCFNQVVRRHETLRTTFQMVDGEPMQVVSPELTLTIPVRNLTGLASEEAHIQAHKLAQAEIEAPFDLAKGPLLRVGLIQLGLAEHILVVTMHHIVSDGWSLGVLVKEVAELYDAFSQNQPSPLPELPLQYADFTLWQKEYLQGEVWAEQLGYWKKQLGDQSGKLELPTDRPRPAVQTYRGGNVPFIVEPELSQKLGDLARREQATLFMVLLAGYYLLLNRYTGQTLVTVGSPIANRNQAEIEGLIGCFINMLALRVDVAGNPTVRELVSRVRHVTLDGYANQDLPFEEVVEALQVERDLSRPPLFDVMFILQNTPARKLRLGGLHLEPVEMEGKTAKFDFTLAVYESNGRLEGNVEYNQDLFDAPTIERMVGHYRTILESMAENPVARLSEIAWITPAERNWLLSEWNQTDGPFPTERLLHEWFEAQVERTPAATAVVFADRSLSYAELNEEANRLARHLNSLGVQNGELVGIAVERSLEMIVGLLGIVKSGGAYVPLEPSFPAARIEWIANNLKLRCLVTQTSRTDLDGLVAGLTHMQEVVCLPDVVNGDPHHVPPVGSHQRLWTAPDWSSQTSGNLPRLTTPDQLAYIIFTSGSTGTPKGVVVAHRPVANLIDWVNSTFAVGPQDRVLFITSLGFDLSVYDVFGLLAAGGSIRVASRSDLQNPETLVQILCEDGITFWDSAPSALLQLVSFFPKATGALTDRLRLVFLSGDWIPVPLPDAVRSVFHNARVISLGGATEATVWSNFYPIQNVDPAWPSIPYGRPMRNARYYVLDEQYQPCPVGIPGDLYISGVCLALGYIGEPQLTAEKFLPHPHSPIPGDRIYKTGDRARFKADGNLEFLGRIDQQVKIRGYRIELGEIEVALNQHPAVRDTVVTAREDEPRVKRLVAYVIPQSGQTPAVTELRSFLKERLPEYMIPSAFVMLEAFPVTSNGKLDRKALPAPDGARPDLEKPYIAPRTQLEAKITALWSSLLGVEQIGVDDNFFELGGHSLLATRVVSALRTELRQEIPLRSLFEAPTPAALARKLTETSRPTAGVSLAPIVHHETEEPAPLSFVQERMWFFNQLDPAGFLYNMPFAIRLRGTLQVPLLERSLAQVLERHAALRANFPAPEGKARQVIAPAGNFTLPVLDLSQEAESGREQRAREVISEQATRGFDLATDPLFRTLVIKLDETDHILVGTFHHIVADGWSIGLLVREMGAFYDALVRGTEPLVKPLRIQYTDYARWQREHLQNEVLEQQLAYWDRQLGTDLPVLELPTDRPRPEVQSTHGATLSTILPKALLDGLHELSRKSGGTLFMTLLAGFQTLLYRTTGQPDFGVGTPIANRNRVETEDLIGCFVNTLVLRSQLEGSWKVERLLETVRETALGAYAHQDAPFEMVVERLAPKRDLGQSPLFQVMFTLENAPLPPLRLAGLTLEPLPAESPKAMFDLTLSMAETADGLLASLEYNRDLFERSTIERLLEQLEILLSAFVSHPDLTLAELPLMTGIERERLLVEWNQTEAGFAAPACLHQLFEAQAARTPNLTAVEFEGIKWSYQKLNQEANQLAHFLIQQGIGPESLVAICVERSLEMMVGLLGILKAGGAYVPLDPEYPAERLAYLLGDASPAIILTQEKLAPTLPPTPAQVVVLDGRNPVWSGSSKENPESGVTPENPAYLIYTSGSTGQPKGVVIRHGSVCNHMLWLQRDLPLTPADRVVQKYSSSFDASLCELFGPLLAGACLVLAKPGGQQDGLYLAELLVNQKITVMDLVPSLLEALLDDPQVVAGNSLRRLQCGGEALSLGLRDRILSETRAELFNLYGPTETTISSTFFQCQPGQNGRQVPIGRPIANTQVYVLDRNWQPVPTGIPGELFIGGAGVARCYHNQPARTAERFLPDPFSGVPGSRLYATGDRVRFLADGTLEFLGRVDDQVKVRGYRIELGEIETVLKEHPLVQEAVVLARPFNKGTRLVGYITTRSELKGLRTEQQQKDTVTFDGPVQNPQSSVLSPQSFLQSRLPEYMVPSVIVELEAMPLTPGGKIDRKALPEPEMKTAAPGTTALPRNEMEQKLREIWAQVLGTEEIGVNDNFFDLGGDSILSIQIVARANRAGIRLTPKQLFQHPTIAGLATVAGASPRFTAEQGEISGHVPLTPIQHWFLEQNFAERHRWNQSVLLAVQGPVEPDQLKQAVTCLVSHHDALRLRFTRTTKGWTEQHVPVAECDSWIHFDFAQIPAEKREETIFRTTEMVQNSLDLAVGPVFKVALMTFGPQEPVRLFLTAHHLVVDAVSWRILLEDFQTLAEHLSSGLTPSLPEKTTSFKHWSEYLSALAQGELLRRELAFWSAPARSQATRLPLDMESGDDLENSLEGISGTLSKEETRSLLQEVPAVYHTQVNDFLLAALGLTLGHWTGNQRHLVDLEGHGREGIGDAPDVSRTVGWFTAVYPVLLEISAQTQPGDAIKSVKDQLRQIPHKGIGYGMLRYLHPEEEIRNRLAGQPQAEVLFNYLGQFDQVLTEGARMAPAPEPKGADHSPQARRSHTFEINVHVAGGQLQVNWAYSRNRHRRETVETLSRNYLEALRALIRHCLTPDAGGFTPSDFPGAKISQKDLDRLMLSLSRKKSQKL